MPDKPSKPEAQQLPEKDLLMTRPSEEPLPAAQDPHVHEVPANPKQVPPAGQAADPRVDDVDYSV